MLSPSRALEEMWAKRHRAQMETKELVDMLRTLADAIEAQPGQVQATRRVTDLYAQGRTMEEQYRQATGRVQVMYKPDMHKIEVAVVLPTPMYREITRGEDNTNADSIRDEGV